jgi:hypothetical protein
VAVSSAASFNTSATLSGACSALKASNSFAQFSKYQLEAQIQLVNVGSVIECLVQHHGPPTPEAKHHPAVQPHFESDIFKYAFERGKNAYLKRSTEQKQLNQVLQQWQEVSSASSASDNDNGATDEKQKAAVRAHILSYLGLTDAPTYKPPPSSAGHVESPLSSSQATATTITDDRQEGEEGEESIETEEESTCIIS